MATSVPLSFTGGRILRKKGRPYRVVALCGTNYGYVWQHELNEIVANIESGKHYYYSFAGPEATTVIIGVDKAGNKYLKAHKDADEPVKLLALPLDWK